MCSNQVLFWKKKKINSEYPIKISREKKMGFKSMSFFELQSTINAGSFVLRSMSRLQFIFLFEKNFQSKFVCRIQCLSKNGPRQSELIKRNEGNLSAQRERVRKWNDLLIDHSRKLNIMPSIVIMSFKQSPSGDAFASLVSCYDK